MNIRKIKLTAGPYDGLESMASHNTAFCQNEAYVYDGGEDPNRFVHVDTVLARLPEEQRRHERAHVATWMEKPHAPLAELLGIPPWRIHAWMIAINNDILV